MLSALAYVRAGLRYRCKDRWRRSSKRVDIAFDLQVLCESSPPIIQQLCLHTCTPTPFECPSIFCRPAPSATPPGPSTPLSIPPAALVATPAFLNAATFLGLDPRPLVLFSVDALIAPAAWRHLAAAPPSLTHALGAPLATDASDTRSPHFATEGSEALLATEQLMARFGRQGVEHIVTLSRRCRVGLFAAAPAARAHLAARIVTRHVMPMLHATEVGILTVIPAIAPAFGCTAGSL